MCSSFLIIAAALLVMFEQTDFYVDVPRQRVYRSLKRAVIEESPFVHSDKSAISLDEAQIEATLSDGGASAVVFDNKIEDDEDQIGVDRIDEVAPTFGASTFVAS